MAKILLVILFFMVVRWSWPRFRFDQLMGLGWKVMLPLGMVNLAVVAVLVEWRTAMGSMEHGLSALAGWIALAVAWAVSAWAPGVIRGPSQRPLRSVGS
jgi:NADH-quinone oxidoreductase subunit H